MLLNICNNVFFFCSLIDSDEDEDDDEEFEDDDEWED